jgi:serine/threonine protein kinase
MHEVGEIIHLDLHAYNFRVRDNGNLCLVDFGCAKILGKDGKIPAGTEAWYYDGISSPEAVERKEFGFGCDVWQVAVLL